MRLFKSWKNVLFTGHLGTDTYTHVHTHTRTYTHTHTPRLKKKEKSDKLLKRTCVNSEHRHNSWPFPPIFHLVFRSRTTATPLHQSTALILALNGLTGKANCVYISSFKLNKLKGERVVVGGEECGGQGGGDLRSEYKI